MSRTLFILLVTLSIVCSAMGFWMGASAVRAAPIRQLPHDSPDPIPNAADDVGRFFHANGFDGNFKFMAAVRDESLNRRYYRVRVSPDQIAELRQTLTRGWTWGHFNRAVYENNISSRVPRSHNLPKWWRPASSPAVVTTMLDHAGKPNWYLVFCPNGEVDMLWLQASQSRAK